MNVNLATVDVLTYVETWREISRVGALTDTISTPMERLAEVGYLALDTVDSRYLEVERTL